MTWRGARWVVASGRRSPWLVSAAAAAGILASTADARAGVTLGVAPTRPTQRASNEGPYDISYADCISNNNLKFDVTITEWMGTTKLFEIWAGTQDCKLRTERQGMTATCHPIASQTPTTNNFSIEIEARKIAAFFPTVTTCEDTNTATGARPITLYFMLVDSSGADVSATDANAWDKTSVDLLGPTPPVNVDARKGEGKLTVNFKTTDSATNVTGYHFYCDHASEGASSGSAGSGGSGGGGGAGGTGGAAGGSASGGTGGAAPDAGTSNCNPDVLVAGALTDPIWRANANVQVAEGEEPPFPLYCGKTEGATQVSGYTNKVLTNGTTYAVAVAGYDKVGNIGRLSQPDCATPTPVDDLWDLYREFGGGGGGCACSLEQSAGLPISAGFAAGGIFTTLALVWRRSRRARQPKTPARERA